MTYLVWTNCGHAQLVWTYRHFHLSVSRPLLRLVPGDVQLGGAEVAISRVSAACICGERQFGRYGRGGGLSKAASLTCLSLLVK